LIEMLAVILILSILMGVLLTSMFGASQTANEQLTKARLTQIDAALGNFEGETGDYPPSRFDDALSASGAAQNRGIEALVKTIFAMPYDGLGLSDDLLGNVDGDSAKGEQLFELVDLWGNPIAYFRRTDYGQSQSYLTFDNQTGEEIENEVKARKSAKTGRWANRQSFQLISAGIDGRFGTDDDLGNFEMPEPE
jgi:type II secretory pathway pseudopilin PulG